MKITFAYAGRIGGTGQGYIASNILSAAVRRGALYQAFATAFDRVCATDKGEFLQVEVLDEFVIMHGIVSKLLARLGLTYYLSNISFDNKVAKKIKRCDVFHAFASQSLRSMKRAKRLGAKIVADNPNTHPLNIQGILAEEYKIWKVPYPAYNKIALKRRLCALDIADRTIVLSRTSYDSFIRNGYPRELLRIVPYGVDSRLFRPRPKDDATFRVLFIGQICLRKGFQYLLEAWRLLDIKDAELILVGGIKPDGVYALREYEGKIDFKLEGPLNDMDSIARVYNRASVAVVPSIEEGFGMVVTEAMASGLPVIISENVGARDLVTDGEEGFIIPIRNARAIGNAIRYLYEDEGRRKEMGKKARNRIEDYTWERYQDALMKVYKDLMQDG